MDEGRFDNFDLTFERQGDLYRPRVLESPLGQQTGSLFSPLHLADSTARMGLASSEALVLSRTPQIKWEAARTLGGELYETALSGGIRETLAECRNQLARQGKGIRIRLHLSGVPELAELPWEYIYDQEQHSFLSLENPLVRYVANAQPLGAPPVQPPLRILGVVTPPRGGSPADAEWEWQNLRRRLEEPVRRGQVILDRLQPPTAESLYNRMHRGGYHLLHFAGHNAFGQEGDTLRLEDDRGRSRILTRPELGEILSQGHARLVVLNTAQSGESVAPLSTAAESLVRTGVPAVVAVPYETMGAAAEPFSGKLYERLSEGEPVETAMAKARQALVAGRDAEWGIPAIYTSAPEKPILALDTERMRSRGISVGSPPQGGRPSDLQPPGSPADVPPPGSLAGPPPPPNPPRFLQGRFRDTVPLGSSALLQVRIALDKGEGRSAALQDVTVPPEGLEVLLGVHAPGFEHQGPDHQMVKVPQAGDSDWKAFLLKAVRPGVHSVEVAAYANREIHLGTLFLQVTVDTGLSASENREWRQPLRRRLQRSDEITLRIRYDGDQKVYRFHLYDGTTDPLADTASQRLLATPLDQIALLVSELNEVARGRIDYDLQTRDWLQGKGIKLWKSLIPEEVRRRFWDVQDRITRIVILSGEEGDPVPWELLYPFEPGTSNDIGFLAERFQIGRWISSRNVPCMRDAMSLSQAEFVNPVSNPPLPRAQREIDEIRGLVERRGVRAGDPVGDLSALLRIFGKGSFNLLHFACHNSYTQPLAIRMGKQPFQPDFLGKYQRSFEKLSPLVFVNACRTDAQQASYTDLTGWAKAFLETGAGAFVGTLWEVRDETAGIFAREFYRALLGDGSEPCSLGDAVQAGRNAIREYADDPTWLAYTLYGDTTAFLTPGGIV